VRDEVIEQAATAACRSTDRAAQPRAVRAVLLGYGRIGQAVASLALEARRRLRHAGLDLRIDAALVRDERKPRGGPAVPLARSVDAQLAAADVVVEVLGGVEPAATLVERALRTGIPVVTANKSLMAAHGPSLRALARECGTPLLFDAAVIAGVPFVGSLARRPFASIASGLEGILNGTSHFVLTQMALGRSFDDALRDAVTRGLAEPDASADVSGRDAAEKLCILLQLCASWAGGATELTRIGIDRLVPQDLAAAAQLFGTIKPVALATLDPRGCGAYVGPAFVPRTHAFSRLDGIANALTVVGPLRQRTTFAGAGAGPAVTAATVLDDVIEAVAAGRSHACGSAPPRAIDLCAPPASGWLIRLNDSASSDTESIERLFPHPLTPTRILAVGDFVYVRTRETTWPVVRHALADLGARGISGFAIPSLSSGDSTIG
jgi:homoserine dehydrogenase